MARRKTKLEVVAVPDKKASVLVLGPEGSINGDENEDLLCGSCGLIVVKTGAAFHTGAFSR